jgi:hypothetical protein
MSKPSYVMQVPVLSTVHLKSRTYYRLEFDVANGVCAGAIMFQPGTEKPMSLFAHVEEDLGVIEEDDLRELFRWALLRRYDWIRFDGEIGDIVDGLPTFAETWK